MVQSKFVLKYIFLKLQDLEKETEFIFLLGLPTDTQKRGSALSHFAKVVLWFLVRYWVPTHRMEVFNGDYDFASHKQLEQKNFIQQKMTKKSSTFLNMKYTYFHTFMYNFTSPITFHHPI